MLKDLVTVICGGACGLGLGTVYRFMEHGSKVVLTDLPRSNGSQIAQSLQNKISFVPMDVTDEESVQSALKEINNNFGKVDVLVNTAGIAAAFKIYNHTKKLSHSITDFNALLKVNTLGVFNLIRLFVGHMSKNTPNENGQRGVIINTGSTASFDGQIGQSAYASSKGGVASMTLPLARDLAPLGIRVVTIVPGIFDTPVIYSIPVKFHDYLKDTMIFPQRLGKPDEFAKLVQHIVENPFLNGTVIRLDSGMRS